MNKRERCRNVNKSVIDKQILIKLNVLIKFNVLYSVYFYPFFITYFKKFHLYSTRVEQLLLNETTLRALQIFT